MSIGKSYGGVENYILTLIKRLGTQYDIFVCCKNHTKFAEVVKDCISPDRQVSYDFSKKTFFKDAKKLKMFCKVNDISIVHCNGIGAAVCCALKRNKCTKYVYTIHGDTDFDRLERSKIVRFLFKHAENFAMKRMDMNISVSKDICSKIKRRGIKANKLTVIYNGIEIDKISNRQVFDNKDGENIRLVSLGRLEPVKAYDVLIEAFKLLNQGNNHFYLDIYGTGSEHDHLQRLISNCNLEDRVVLKGFDKDAKNHIMEYDFYIQSSLYETFGLTLLESMMSGTPVICSAVGGMKEIVQDSINGFIIDEISAGTIADTIIRASKNSKREQIIKNAYKTLGEFSAEKMACRTKEIYLQLE